MTREWYEDTVTVNVVNDTPPSVPEISIDSLDENVTGEVAINVTVSDPTYMRYVYFYINGKPIGCDWRSPFQFIWNTRYFEDGEDYTIKASSYHGAMGKTYESKITVNVNNGQPPIVPTISINSHTDGQTISGNQIITISSNDIDNLRYMSLYVDGRVVRYDFSAPYSIICYTRRYTNGTHTFKVRIYHSILRRYIVSEEISLNIEN